MINGTNISAELDLDCNFEHFIDENGCVQVTIKSVELRGVEIKHLLKRKEIYGLELSIEADFDFGVSNGSK